MGNVLTPRTDGRNQCMQNVGLWSTPTMRVAVWVDEDDSVYFAKAPANQHGTTGAWQKRKLGTGTSASVETNGLRLPQAHDNHKWYSICVQESSGKVIIAGNMWSLSNTGATLCYIETTGAVDPNAPIANDTFVKPMGNEPPGVATVFVSGTNRGWTYPMFGQFADGTLMWTMRGGETGSANTYMWTRAPGASTWTFKTQLFHGHTMSVAFTDGDTEMSAYHNSVYIEGPWEPHPDRLHYAWMWRGSSGTGGAGVGLKDPFPSYAYSDDQGTTWKSIDGTTITAPFEPMTDTAAHMNQLADPASTDPYWPYAENAQGAGLQIMSSLTIDADGFQHCVGASQTITGQQGHMWWDGSNWQFESIGGATLSGHSTWFVFSRCALVTWDGSVWCLCEIGGVGIGSNGPGRMGLIELGVTAGTARVHFMGNNMYREGMYDNSTYGSGLSNPGFVPQPDGWSCDPEARRRYGRIEWIVPQGPNLYVRGLGTHALVL